MYLPVTSKTYLCIPLDGPADAGDLTRYPPQIALVPDDGREPALTDWHTAVWLNGMAALLVGPGGTVAYPAGQYMAFATLTAGLEAPVMPSGRVRIGDTRP